MASTIKLKNGSGAPLASDLVQGEPAFDLTNKRLYTEDSGGNVIEVGTNPSSLTTSSADINGGTIDGTVIGGSSAAAGTFTSITGTSLSISGSAVISGVANANLQLASSGGNTYQLRTDVNDVFIYQANRAAPIANFAYNGDVSLYEDTGTTAKFFWDASAESLGIGTSSPDHVAHVVSASTGDLLSAQYTGGSKNPEIRLLADSDSVMRINAQNSDNTVALGVTVSGTERMRIDSSGRVGIGTSPDSSTKLDVLLGASSRLLFRERSSRGYIDSVNETNSAFDSLGINGSEILFETGATERMRIDSSGNVGIGTSSPAQALAVESDSVGVTRISVTNTGNAAAGSGIQLITKNGETQVSNATLRTDNAGNFSIFSGTTSETERMRINSSGVLSVANTTTAYGLRVSSTLTGMSYTPTDYLTVSADGVCHYANRIGSDGDIAVFNKDGTAVGAIGNTGGGIYVRGQTTGIYFGTNDVVPSLSSGNLSDNAKSLGAASYRWSVVYAATGSINTSDRNEKTDIVDIDAAELRVAQACKGLMKRFKFKDSVEAKGDDARYHFGIIAQDLQAAFEAEGLDASKYAVFCSDTWTDEETGEERTRLGVRYEELLAFIIAAI